jgi:hypothetical protein
MDVQNAHYINDCVTSLLYPEICILVICSGSHYQECAGKLDRSTELPQSMNNEHVSQLQSSHMLPHPVLHQCQGALQAAVWLEKILIRPWYSCTNILGQASTMCTHT